jgi:anti-sigma-K factor RskA
MTVQELIELAVLDAVGLLDADERDAFENAFAAASPELQAQVRREQTRLSSLQHVLPDVAPPAGLRAAVIEAVREAIAQDLVSGGAHASLGLTPSKRVSRWWRAGAVGAMAAAVVFGVATLQMRSEYTQLRKSIQKNQLIDQITSTMGSRFVEDTLFDANTRHVIFNPGAAVEAQACVFTNPDWESAKLFALNLGASEGQRFRLAVIDEAGNVVRELATFEAGAGLETQDIPSNVLAQAANRSLALLREGGEAVLTVPGPMM